MPNLNMPGQGGGRMPVQPMMPGRETGGVVKKIVIFLVIALLGGGGYYFYKSGKIPFLKKAEPLPPPVEILPPPDTSAMKAIAPIPTTTPPPPTDKKATSKSDSKTTATPTQPAMGKGDFTIVIGSFHDKIAAEEEAARWSSAGFQSLVYEKVSGGGTWYRLSLGRYETRREAAKTAKDMEHMFESGFWIDKVQ